MRVFVCLCEEKEYGFSFYYDICRAFSYHHYSEHAIVVSMVIFMVNNGKMPFYWLLNACAQEQFRSITWICRTIAFEFIYFVVWAYLNFAWKLLKPLIRCSLDWNVKCAWAKQLGKPYYSRQVGVHSTHNQMNGLSISFCVLSACVRTLRKCKYCFGMLITNFYRCIMHVCVCVRVYLMPCLTRLIVPLSFAP